MPFPETLRLQADGALRRLDGGRLAVGGAPLRLVRLSTAGARRLDAWLDGMPVGEAPAAKALARRLLDAGMVHPRAELGYEAPLGVGDVTVVVPVRDDAEGLAQLLAALGGSLPAVVVDDASADPAATAGVARRFGARLAPRQVNGGPGAARNTGLEMVDTPVVVFVDSDAVVDPPAIAALLSHFVDPAVAAAAPRVRSRPGPGLLSCYEAACSPLDMGDAPSAVGPRRRVRYVPAAVLAVRTGAARAAGGFDEGLRCGEDVDFVWRLAAGGATVRYEPSAVAWHRPRASWRAWAAQRRRYGASAADLAERHGTAVAPARCTCSAAVAWTALACVRPRAAAVTVAAVVVAVSSVRLAGRLRSVTRMPLVERLWLAASLAIKGHWLAGLGLARAVTRAWLPLALCGAVASRRLRVAALVAALAPPLVDWLGGARPAGPAATLGLRLADDAAYCTGVWQGMAARRRADAIRPALAARVP